MKFKTALLIAAMGSSALANTSSSEVEANTLEGTVKDVKKSTPAAPWVFNNDLSFHSNLHSIMNDAKSKGISIHEDSFVNKLSVKKSFAISDIAGFQTTYTPSISAAYLETSEGKESDKLDSANINNNLTMKKTSGNIQYGLSADAGYNYGYVYLARNSGKGINLYRRNENNANARVGFQTGISISNHYKLVGKVGVGYEDFQGVRQPQFADLVRNGITVVQEHVGDEYDRTTYSAGFENQIIINKNFSVAIPIDYVRFDYQQFNAIADTNDWGPTMAGTRLIDVKTIGIKGSLNVSNLQFSTGVKVGRWDDKVLNTEDSDYGRIETSASYSFTDQLSMSASHSYEYWTYDDVGDVNDDDERYNTYNIGITMSQIAGLPMDATLAHNIFKEQCNFGIGRSENETTSLNLSFKL